MRIDVYLLLLILLPLHQNGYSQLTTSSIYTASTGGAFYEFKGSEHNLYFDLGQLMDNSVREGVIVKKSAFNFHSISNKDIVLYSSILITSLLLLLFIVFFYFQYKVKKHKRLIFKIKQMQSHDLRGPIATILGLTKVLKKNEKYEQSEGYIIDGIEEMAKKLDSTIVKIIKDTKNEI